MTWNARLVRWIELPTAALAVDVSSDGTTLWAACHDGVWRVAPETGDQEKIASHQSWASGVGSVELASGESVLVSGGYDGRLLWTDSKDGRSVRGVDAHRFWSWQLAKSPDGRRIASATGQYLCGSYEYRPRPASEPTVRVFDSETGAPVRSFELLPPVLSVAFDATGNLLAAGNLMGDVRVWSTETGEEVAAWNTPSFTGWGIIKGHYYTGGIYSLAFSPDGEDLYLAGMGTTRDPAAGNGRQLWERYAWREKPAVKRDETHEGESGQGLMETIRFHPSEPYFVMGGRIQKGEWNVAFFDRATGAKKAALSTETRVTDAVFSRDGKRLFLAGAVGQNSRLDGGGYRKYGRIGVFALPGPVRIF